MIIMGYFDQWDEYERRDRALVTQLAHYDDVERIIYIQPVLPLTSLIKYLLGKADQYAAFAWKQLFSKGLIQNYGKITIVPSFSLLSIYRRYSLHRLNLFITNRLRILQVKCLARIMCSQNTKKVLWISNPYFNDGLIGKLRENVVCYNLCENYIHKHSDPEYCRLLSDEDIRISLKSDLLFMASEELVQEKKALNKHTYLVPNGVDFESVQSGYQMSRPADIEKINRPVIGFVGLISRRLDFSLIEYLAAQRPGWSFVFVGPVSADARDEVKKLHTYSNIHLLGGKSAQQIPAYLAFFDVCSVLYSQNYGNKAGNAMKLHLYLASGKPVVSYSVGGAQNIPELVYLAQTPSQYLQQVEYALAHDDNAKALKRLAYAKENSWNKRAEDMHALIVKTIGHN